MSNHLHPIDIAILSVYLSTLAGIGLYFARRQKKLEDYFLARQRMAWLPIGLSLMAALNSGIDYVMQPGAVIKFGLILLVGNLSWLLLYPYVSVITVPMYRRLIGYSAYEYLERRFNLAVRSMGAGIFLMWRIGWMATALYVPCLAISTVMGRTDLLIPMIVVLGCLVTFYTMLGGIQAVIWTDVTQFCVMFLGLAVTLVITCWSVPGGIGALVNGARSIGAGTSDAAAHAVSSADSSFPGLAALQNYFSIPVTASGWFIAIMVSRLATYTSDQVMVQRFQTTRSVSDARRGFLITAISDVVWMSALALVGLSLFVYFQHHPLPSQSIQNTDNYFLYFVRDVFPVGLTGLVIAAILAASLSSIDSALNSMTSVLIIDFYRRIFCHCPLQGSDQDNGEEQGSHEVAISRLCTLAVGALGTVLSCNVIRWGTVFEIANKLIISFSGPLLGVFLLGMFTRRASASGVFVGGVVGTGITLYSIHLSNLHQVSSMWPSVFGLLTTVAVGIGLGIFFPNADPDRNVWTWRHVMNQQTA